MAFRATTSWSIRSSCRSGAINDAGARLMYLIRRLRDELKVNTSCGASNFSFGLPNRRGLNAGFLPMMIGAGLTSAIMNPLHPEDRQAILGADVVHGPRPQLHVLDPGLSRASAGGRGRRAARGTPSREGRMSSHRVVFTPSGKTRRFRRRF